MLPADQRLDADDASGSKLGLGLVVDDQLVLVDRSAEVGDQRADPRPIWGIRPADGDDAFRVDRNVLRLAIYEMLFREDIPPVVSINEAIELAKKFGGAESGRFVNGILDRVKDDLTRPLREPVSRKPADEGGQS